MSSVEILSPGQMAQLLIAAPKDVRDQCYAELTLSELLAVPTRTAERICDRFYARVKIALGEPAFREIESIACILPCDTKAVRLAKIALCQKSRFATLCPGEMYPDIYMSDNGVRQFCVVEEKLGLSNLMMVLTIARRLFRVIGRFSSAYHWDPLTSTEPLRVENVLWSCLSVTNSDAEYKRLLSSLSAIPDAEILDAVIPCPKDRHPPSKSLFHLIVENPDKKAELIQLAIVSKQFSPEKLDAIVSMGVPPESLSLIKTLVSLPIQPRYHLKLLMRVTGVWEGSVAKSLSADKRRAASQAIERFDSFFIKPVRVLQRYSLLKPIMMLFVAACLRGKKIQLSLFRREIILSPSSIIITRLFWGIYWNTLVQVIDNPRRAPQIGRKLSAEARFVANAASWLSILVSSSI